VYNSTSDEDLKHLIRSMPITIMEASMRTGVVRGQIGDVLNDFFKPDFDDVHYYYAAGNGVFDVVFNYHRHRDIHFVLQRRLIYRADEDKIRREAVVSAFNHVAHLLMNGVRQDNNWCECENPAHVNGKYQSLIGICKPVGDKWLCPNCISRFSLEDINPTHSAPKSKRVSDERTKLTASLRFSILERDNFTCRSCGRNAREDGV